MSSRSPAFARVLDEIGTGIVEGRLPAGSRTSVEALVDSTVASRSIVREATRVLASLGMLVASPRVGLVVRARADWNLLDPLVIGWRLRGPDRGDQLRELRELRQALEPAAAQAAAVHAGPADRTRLRELAEIFDDPAVATDRLAFAAVDTELHHLVLACAGNAMFATLGAVVARAVAERAVVDPAAHDVGLHAELARALADGNSEAADAAMREIVART